MGYRALRFDVAAVDVDAWSDALLAAGALAVDAADARAGRDDETPVYAEPAEPPLAFWPTTRLVALFADDTDVNDALRHAADAAQRAIVPHESFAVPEQDWVGTAQAQFAPIRIEEDLWIVPSWHETPRPAAINLSIDPGRAFGTGSHPTTRLCLAWLRTRVRRGAHVLDYGCGSGVLAIAAAKFGAARVVGTDIDSDALATSADNARINSVDASFVPPNALREEKFDIVVANILTNALLVLAPLIALRVRDDGRIALAGILDTQVDDVTSMYRRWFAMATWRSDEGWALLDGVRITDSDDDR